MDDACRYSDGGFRLERLANGWLAGRFAALDEIGVTHLVTTREGPDVQQIRYDTAAAGRQVAQALNMRDAAFLEQVHGGDVLLCDAGGQVGAADGLVTSTPSLVLLGKSGDCPIVLIGDRQRRAVGFAHASWRATVVGIGPAVVQRMAESGCGPVDLVACICPSAGPECYEVGEEVREAALQRIGPHAAAFFRPGPRGRDHLDLWAANVDALRRAGLRPQAIHVAGLCTICRNDLFPSHRREGDGAGRFLAAIAGS
jgi:YfiH family protein